MIYIAKSYDISVQRKNSMKEPDMIVECFSKKDLSFLLKGFTVSQLFYNFLIEMVDELKIDKEKLEKKTKFPVVKITDKERLPLLKAFRLWRAIESTTKRSDIGLIIADYFTINKAGIIGDLFLNTPNLKESVEIMKRFISIIMDNISLSYEENDHYFIFYFDIVPRFLIPMSVTECYIKICYNWVKEYTQKEQLDVEEINFYGHIPPHLKYYHQILPNTKIYFNHTKNYVILDKKMFYKKNSRKTTNSCPVLIKHAKKIINSIAKSKTFTQKVLNQIIITMPDQKNNEDEISKKLKMSKSTLKRRLKEENENFKNLTENLRKMLSTSLLKDDLSFEEIAYLLGYSEYSPFFRAFKKWYNISPSDYRKQFVNYC